jgi:hypothetical protein
MTVKTESLRLMLGCLLLSAHGSQFYWEVDIIKHLNLRSTFMNASESNGNAAAGGVVNKQGTSKYIIAVPSVEGPIPVDRLSYPFNAAIRQYRPIDLAEYGYIEEEYFISGVARVYAWPGELAEPLPYSGPYCTRILVRKPLEAGRASGNAIVELANWARGYDVSIAAWGEYFDSILVRGDAWVQITIRPAVALRLKKFNPLRYAGLSFASPWPLEMRAQDPLNPAYPYPPSSRETEDGLAWDIISQVGALLKSRESRNPLAGYGVRYLYATGATGGDLSAYVAAIHPNAVLDGSRPIYDGYLIKMTGSPAPINQYTPRIAAGDPRCQLHTNVPVIRVLTEGDIFGFGEHPDWGYKQRRADSDSENDRFRLYEVAGPTVGAKYPLLSGPNQEDVEAAGEKWSGSIEVPKYEFPLRYILNGAMVNLDKWVRYGSAPPKAGRLEIKESDTQGADFIFDQSQNVQGGVRTPYVDVPLAGYPKIGAPVPLDQSVLSRLYKDRAEYTAKFTAGVNRLLKEGWVTPKDAGRMVAEAAGLDVPW